MGDMIVAKLLNQNLDFVDEAVFHLVASDILSYSPLFFTIFLGGPVSQLLQPNYFILTLRLGESMTRSSKDDFKAANSSSTFNRRFTKLISDGIDLLFGQSFSSERFDSGSQSTSPAWHISLCALRVPL
jgi:hypothetical protein